MSKLYAVSTVCSLPSKGKGHDLRAAPLRAGSAGPGRGRGFPAGLRPGDRGEGRVAGGRVPRPRSGAGAAGAGTGQAAAPRHLHAPPGHHGRGPRGARAVRRACHRAAARRHRGRPVAARPRRHRRATARRTTGPGPAAEVLVNMGGSRQRIGIAQWTDATRDVLPQRLGHSLLFTAQPQRMTDFYTQVLGLRVSDTIHHDMVTFLNAGPGDHHIFGFIASTHRGFHHASFEVPSIDAIAVGADRMRAKGRQAGWGLGRHTIGSNFFHYNPDPWGSWIEWFSDIDQIDDHWVAREWDVPPHLWGAPPPETFLNNREPSD